MRMSLKFLSVFLLSLTTLITSAHGTQIAYDAGYTGFNVPLAAYKTFATDLNQTFYYLHFGPSVLRVRPPYTQSDGRALLSTAGSTMPPDVSQIAPHPSLADTVFIVDTVTNVIHKVTFTFSPTGSINPTVVDFITPGDIPNLHSIAVAFEAGQTKVFASGTDPGGNGVIYLAQDGNFNGTATDPGEVTLVAPAVTAPGTELRGLTLATPFGTAAPLFSIDETGVVRVHQDIAPADGTYAPNPPERYVYASGLGGGFRLAAAYDSGHLYATAPQRINGTLTQSKVFELGGDGNSDGQADFVTEVADFFFTGEAIRDLAFTVPFAPFGSGTFAGNFLVVVDEGEVPPNFPTGNGEVTYLQGRLPETAETANGVGTNAATTFFNSTDYETTVTFTSVSGGFNGGSDVNISITVYDSRPPHSSGTKMLNRWWDIEVQPSTAVFTADVVLRYADSDVPSGMTEAEIEGLFRYNGNQWIAQFGTVDTTNNEVTLNGVTGFSPWGIGSLEGFLPTVPSLAFWGVVALLGGLTFILGRERLED